MDQSLFWDDVHPTTAGHNQIAQFAADILPGGHPGVFRRRRRSSTSGDFAYLAFPDGKKFGYYTYQFYPYLYHTDLGFEYVIPSTGTDDGVYLYDYKLSQFLYTSPTTLSVPVRFRREFVLLLLPGHDGPARVLRLCDEAVRLFELILLRRRLAVG